MNKFFVASFYEADNGKIHVYTSFLNKDEDGYFITNKQKKGVFLLLDKIKEAIEENNMELLK